MENPIKMQNDIIEVLKSSPMESFSEIHDGNIAFWILIGDICFKLSTNSEIIIKRIIKNKHFNDVEILIKSEESEKLYNNLQSFFKTKEVNCKQKEIEKKEKELEIIWKRLTQK